MPGTSGLELACHVGPEPRICDLGAGAMLTCWQVSREGYLHGLSQPQPQFHCVSTQRVLCMRGAPGNPPLALHPAEQCARELWGMEAAGRPAQSDPYGMAWLSKEPKARLSIGGVLLQAPAGAGLVWGDQVVVHQPHQPPAVQPAAADVEGGPRPSLAQPLQVRSKG
jgi:hypothetical protein